MSSTDSEDSDLSSTYSSDGEVQLSITRPQRTPGLKYLDFDDVDYSYAVFDTPDSIADCIHPIDVKLFVRPDILTSVRSIPDLNFVYINSPTLTFLEPEEEVPAPHSVICDAYIFKTDGVVLVLTFVSRDEPDAVLYNSTQARALTVAVRSRTCTNFHPVHGVISPNMYRSSQNFLTRIQPLHKTAAHVSVHQSLTSRDGKMVDIFRTMIQHQRPSRILTDWERLFVKTAAYQEVRHQLQQHNLVVLTGGPGEGKTTIGHMLCCDYQQQGYNTVFYSREKDFNTDVFQATKPTLVVVDDMGDAWGRSDLVLEIHKTKVNKLVHVLIIYKSYMGPVCFNRKTDITQIGRQNWDRTKQGYSQMLQMQTDIPSDTREEIISNLPSYVGFPKVMKHFCRDRPTTDPVTYFTYPHLHIRTEIERLLRNNVDYSAPMIYILVSGNKVDNYYPNIFDRGGSEIKSLFPEFRTNTLPDVLHRLCATYPFQSGINISFTDPVIYDACLFVVDSMFPGLLWKHCKVMHETANRQSLTDIPDKTIFISSHNTDMFLTQLVKDTRRGKFRHTFRHPVLSREDNIDRFLTQLGDSFVDVLHLHDIADSSTVSRSFLYWVLQSGNDYLCQKVLLKQELSRVHVSEELACCIRISDTKSFLYLRQQLLGLQRGDITITPDYTDADGNSLLMMSVDKNNADVIKRLLEDDAVCLIKNKVGNSALHLASLRGYTDVVKLLLPHMEDWKNMPGQDLRTPVMMAALKGLGQLYEYLADEGKCDLTGVDDNGDTILHLACQGGSVQIVKHLMSSKLFDINHRGQYGKTPLMIAACRGHRDVFQLLLSQKCHISSEDFSMSETLSYGHVGDCLNTSQFLRAREHGLNGFMLTHQKHYISNLKSHLEEKGSSMLLVDVSGLCLLHTAAETGNLKLAEFLLSKGKVDINTRDVSGRTPVMLAAAAGHRIMFEFLTKNKCDLSLKDTKTRGVLHYASQGGNFGIVQDVGYQDVNETDRYNKTPVSYCVERGHKHIFDTLLNTGGDLSVVDTDKNTLLHLASKGGNQAIVEHLLSSGMFDINAVNRDRRTPLLVAAYTGHTDICQHLIVAGADVHRQDYDGNDVVLVAAHTGNLHLAECVLSVKKRVDFVQDKHGKTAAMWAAERGDADMFTLMSKGCDLSVIDYKQNSILHFACTGGNVDIVESIVAQNKVDFNGRNISQETPVMRAALWGHKVVFDLLVSKGCDLTVKDKNGDNILHKVCQEGNVQIVEYIVSHDIVDINITGYEGRTPVMLAALKGYKAVFGLLVSKGCDLTVKDTFGDSILHAACDGGNVEIVEYIVSLNIVDINSTGYARRTPVMMAVSKGHKAVFDLLVSNGCELTVKDKNNDNILHAACEGGNVEIVEYIVSHNIVDINSTDDGGRTPVLRAVLRGHKAVFDLLVSKGCDLTVKDKYGDNILQKACEGGNVQIVEYIVSHNIVDINITGYEGRTPVMLAALKGYKAVFDLLVSKGCDLTVKDENNDNILHAACEGGNVEIVEYIVSHNIVDINSTGYARRTPVMMAVSKGHKAVFDLLVSKGCELTVKDENNDNILHAACEGGNVEIVEYIVSHNIVDINSTDDGGRTAALRAVLRGYKAVFDLLVSKGCDRTVKDKYGDNTLQKACEGGNVQIVEYIVSHNIVDINITGYEGRTPVMLAALKGYKAVFGLLVSKGCDLTVKDTFGDSILHAACEGGNVEIVEYIVSHNIVDINSTGYARRTPVVMAVSKGHKAVFDLLVSKGCELTVKDKNNDNILHAACEGGNVEIVEYIVSRNIVDINSTDDGVRTPVLRAVLRGHKAVFDLLVSKGCDLTVKDKYGDNILQKACEGGNVQIVEYIVSHYIVDINITGYEGRTPVMLAALKGYKAVFGLLVSKGCDLTVKDTFGDRILHAACEGGNVEIVEFIVSHNIVDINSTGYARRTPVMMAVSKGHKAVFDLLVSKGCELTVKDKNNDNILHAACEGGNVEIVEYIVSHNIVDINSTDDGGRTPVLRAVLRGHKAVFDLLVSKGCDLTVKDKYGDNILQKACEGGNVQIVEYIVSHNIVDINSTGYEGRTLVMLAALKGYKAVFDLLVSKGCDLTVKDKYGDNILHAACVGESVEIVEYIVSHNIVDINSTNYVGRTPVMLAALKGHKAVFDLLVSKGCDLTVKDRNGDNILHAACEGGNVEIVEYIVSHNIVDINSTGCAGTSIDIALTHSNHSLVKFLKEFGAVSRYRPR